MERKYNNFLVSKQRFDRGTFFTSVHPPGGFVAWPVNNTSGSFGGRPQKKGFVAWPQEKAQA